MLLLYVSNNRVLVHIHRIAFSLFASKKARSQCVVRQKICPLAKRKEEFRRNIVAPVFFNSRWEVFFNSRGQYFSTGCGKDGKWIFITLPAGPNQQFFMSQVILPKVFRDKLSTLRIFDFFVGRAIFVLLEIMSGCLLPLQCEVGARVQYLISQARAGRILRILSILFRISRILPLQYEVGARGSNFCAGTKFHRDAVLQTFNALLI